MVSRAPVATPGEDLVQIKLLDLCSLLSKPLEIMPTPSQLRQACDLRLGLR